MTDDSIHLSPLRRELITWFREKAAPLADAYLGAIELLHNLAFPGRACFIAHAVRDICDRLPFVLDPQRNGSRVQYEVHVDVIQQLWEPLHAIQRCDPHPESDAVTITRELASRIGSLVQEHSERRRRPSNEELLFRFLLRNDPSHADLNQRLVSDFKGIRKWFMERTHLRATEPPPVDEAELQVRFKSFERMLHSFVGNFFTGTQELDEILRQANN